MKKNIIIIGPYIPGKLYGGPVKSILNIVEALSTYYNFYIITGDRDLNATETYKTVEIGSWNTVGKANVFYIPKGKDFNYIRNIIKNLDYDLVYTSSFFSKHSVIIQFLKFFNVIKKPLIIAPRGEFSPGALSIKDKKKKIFLMIYKILGIHKKVTYTSTSLLDKKDINNVFGGSIKVWTAGNIVNNEAELKGISREKKIGHLKIVTLSRISKIKNLDYSLNILKKIAESYKLPNEISFDIYGPIEDGEYWKECSSLINKIGNTISINYKGPIDYNDVINVLSKYHIFLLPTQGENFGHVIQEAFLAGCPVIISNKTPWIGLKELQVGFDIPLEQQDEYFSAIKHYLLMDSNDYKNASLKAIEYGMEKVRNQGSIKEHIEMFDNEMNK